MGIGFNSYFLFYLIVAVVWLYRARRALQASEQIATLYPTAPDTAKLPYTTVFVPAKNEEKNIRACLEALKQQEFPRLQIIVINNQSTDSTEAILQSMNIPNLGTLPQNSDTVVPQIGYFNTLPTPDGWTGKNFALWEARKYARGEWYLFTDADTRHEPLSVSTAVEYAVRKDLVLLTLLPRCYAQGFWEWLIQPFAMAYLGLWFPMEKANHPNNDTVFGNGQYLLIHKKSYQAIGGHEAVRTEFLEDYALMRKIKARKERLECAFGTEIYGTRMYDSFPASWRGWRRIFLHAFERKAGTLFLKSLDVFFFSFLPFLTLIPLFQKALAFPETYGFCLGIAVTLLGFIVFTSWKAFELIKAKRIFSFLHPLAGILFTGILFDAFRHICLNKKTVWR